MSLTLCFSKMYSQKVGDNFIYSKEIDKSKFTTVTNIINKEYKLIKVTPSNEYEWHQGGNKIIVNPNKLYIQFIKISDKQDVKKLNTIVREFENLLKGGK